MKQIVIKKVPKNKIRNDSVGDYFRRPKGLEIRVADVGDADYEKGVMIHEMIESLLADKRKINFSKITKWDKKKLNKKGEPGEMKGAPYFKEHAVANLVENILVKELKKKR
jgi:hypothetical protein